MPDDFPTDSFLIVNAKVYYASGKDKDVHIKSVETDGNVAQIV